MGLRTRFCTGAFAFVPENAGTDRFFLGGWLVWERRRGFGVRVWRYAGASAWRSARISPDGFRLMVVMSVSLECCWYRPCCAWGAGAEVDMPGVVKCVLYAGRLEHVLESPQYAPAYISIENLNFPSSILHLACQSLTAHPRGRHMPPRRTSSPLSNPA